MGKQVDSKFFKSKKLYFWSVYSQAKQEVRGNTLVNGPFGRYMHPTPTFYLTTPPSIPSESDGIFRIILSHLPTYSLETLGIILLHLPTNSVGIRRNFRNNIITPANRFRRKPDEILGIIFAYLPTNSFGLRRNFRNIIAANSVRTTEFSE